MFVVRCILVSLVALVACGSRRAAPDPDALTAVEEAQLAKLSPLGPLPPDPTNAVADDVRAARLGQMLFFDEALSGPLLVDSALGKAGEPAKVSCATCHGGPALDDQHSRPNHVSIGTGVGIRNSPPLVNAAYYRWSNWGGRFDSQWSLVLGAIENPEVMNGTRLAVVRTVFAKYRAEYDALFPAPLDPALDPAAPDAARFPTTARPKAAQAADGAWEAMAASDRELVDRSYANIGKAIAAYLRLLVARNAPFDRYVAGDRTAISAASRRGARLYLAHCKSCHGGPHLQDNGFHAIGVAQFGAHVPATDLGRFGDVPPLLASRFAGWGPHSDAKTPSALAQEPVQRGQFRTPTLRNVAVTAPYMHAGQFATLAAVVAFYNIGGGNVDGVDKDREMKPLGLTPTQQADLVEWMGTLTDTAVPPQLLVDTAR